MVIFGQKPNRFEKLEDLSEELIDLGQEIEGKLQEKKEIEAKILENQNNMSQLRMETFSLKERLIKIKISLSKLENRRQETENGNQNTKNQGI